MNRDQYLQQNAKGYEGDPFLHDQFKALVEKFDITTIVETGTFLGATTKRLAELAERVFTVECNEENYNIANAQLHTYANVKQYFGDSAALLPRIIEENNLKKRVLFFLDAHWYDHCPLLEELEIIGDYGIKPVIAIHDFKVPGRPDLGYDTYKGQDFEWEWIKDAIMYIYGDGNFTYHYNDQAGGAKRGVIFIYPKMD